MYITYTCLPLMWDMQWKARVIVYPAFYMNVIAIDLP